MYIHVGTVNTSNTWKQNPPPREMFLYAPVTSNQSANKGPIRQSFTMLCSTQAVRYNGDQKNICDTSPSALLHRTLLLTAICLL